MLEGFEAMGDLELEDVEIETPIEKCMTPMISGRKLALFRFLELVLVWFQVFLPCTDCKSRSYWYV